MNQNKISLKTNKYRYVPMYAYVYTYIYICIIYIYVFHRLPDSAHARSVVRTFWKLCGKGAWTASYQLLRRIEVAVSINSGVHFVGVLIIRALPSIWGL